MGRGLYPYGAGVAGAAMHCSGSVGETQSAGRSMPLRGLVSDMLKRYLDLIFKT